MYLNASDFCENVWDHSWKYTDDNQPCMKIWFDDPSQNPNKIVAQYYLDKSCSHNNFSQSIFLILTLLALSINNILFNMSKN
ncbi:hypothetical protein B4U79_10797 [Dinothrombium tinctorium]|uniref:Uncharacterized protein n=1 Tax=Dinothrombium tinctorium TaxID=1965070 RepID=A0A3S3NZ62_9ACAR|nr:hypothetical protein B4U79_03336 [Dinothrombium tinctorium]RWS12038.1 hypothetical protein B4U79_10797 [Dinothrombium tinctorium]